MYSATGQCDPGSVDFRVCDTDVVWLNLLLILLLLLFHTYYIQGGFIANFMKINTSKTRNFFLEKSYESCINCRRTGSSIKELGIFINSKRHLHRKLCHVFSQHAKLWGLIRTVFFFFIFLPLIFVNDMFYLICKIREHFWQLEFCLLMPTT